MKVDFEVWLFKVYEVTYNNFLKNYSSDKKEKCYKKYISYLKN